MTERLYTTTPLQDLYHIPLYPSTKITKEQLLQVEQYLKDDPVNGHRKAYMDLYTWTGNPAFRDNLFIATKSGTIGGMAWNANQIILEKYPEEYPKQNNELSIPKFSWLVGAKNVELIRKNFDKTGVATVPDERTLRRDGDGGAWKDQDLKKDNKFGDLTRVSPPLHQAAMDAHLTKDMSQTEQLSRMLGAAYLPFGSKLASTEAQDIIEQSYKRVRQQKQTEGKDKVWMGLGIHEVCDNIIKSGHSFSIKKVKDTYIVTDDKGMPHGAFTKDMIIDTLNMRAYKEMNEKNLSFNDALQSYINKYKGINGVITQALPELKQVFNYNTKVSTNDDNKNTGLEDINWYSKLLATNTFHNLNQNQQSLVVDLKSNQENANKPQESQVALLDFSDVNTNSNATKKEYTQVKNNFGYSLASLEEARKESSLEQGHARNI